MTENTKARSRTLILIAALSVVIAMVLLPIMGESKANAASDDFYVPLTLDVGFDRDYIKMEGEQGEFPLDIYNHCFYSYSGVPGSLPLDGLIRTSDGKVFQFADYRGSNGKKIWSNTAEYMTLDESSIGTYKKIAVLVTGIGGGGRLWCKVTFDDFNSSDSFTQDFVIPDWEIVDDSQKFFKCGRCNNITGEVETDRYDYGLYECVIEIPEEYKDHDIVRFDFSLTDKPDFNKSEVEIFAISGIMDASKRAVVFDANGGNSEVKKLTTDVNATIDLPTATKEGYRLLGWYDGTDFVGKAGDKYTVTKNVILKALWQERQYIMGNENYDGGHGTNKIFQSDDGAYPGPGRQNYRFVGWSDTPDGAVIPDSQLTNGGTYYAQWERTAYDMYIQGVQVTVSNQGNILGDGKVSFDPSTSTLTLSNATIKAAELPYDYRPSGIFINEKMSDFNLVLNGTNRIIVEKEIKSNTVREIGGISFNDSNGTDIDISGGGVLDIDMIRQEDQTSSCIGLETKGNVVIDRAKVDICIRAGNYVRGLRTNGTLLLKNGAVLISDAGTGSDNIGTMVLGYGPLMDDSCYLETKAGGNALSSFEYKDSSGVGALVNTEPTKKGARPWDKKTDIYEYKYVSMPEVHSHKWGSGKVTKPATMTAEGERLFICTQCGETRTEKIAKIHDPSKEMGKDGTALGEGASAQAADKAITSLKGEKDPKGTVFSKLKLKSAKQTKNTIKLNWTKVRGVKKYVIYANKCGPKNKCQKTAEVTGNTKTLNKVAGKKLKKGTYYKIIIVALDKNDRVVSTSKLIHAATKGGKVGNQKSVSVKKAVIRKAKKLKKGKSLKLNAKAVAQSKKLKVRKHTALRYESTNKKIATVSGKGVVKARKKGSCYIYAYAQNGVFKKIKVTVK